MKKIAAILVVAVILTGVVVFRMSKSQNITPEKVATESKEEKIMKRADEVVLALMSKNTSLLSSLAHQDKGVVFSPYASIKSERGKFTNKEIKIVLTNNKVINWGNYAGSGKEITLKMTDYWDKFVYDQDFAGAEVISYNKKARSGNMSDNAAEVWPRAKFVEYHFSGLDKKYEGMDWESLRLYFEEANGKWWLVGVVHDGGTI